MEKELQDLSQTLIEIYTKNLEFLKKEFNDLYNEVEHLSKQIEDDKYEIKYSLEYKDGYFDIFNQEENAWFYHTNSYDDADFRTQNTNFTLDGSIDLLRKDTTGQILIGSSMYEDIMPILHYMSDTIDFQKVEFEKIYKFIFMGTGLGFHIHEISKKLDPFVTLIIEPSLEIFRLSLFTIDYTTLQQQNRKLFLSVGDDYLQRQKELSSFNLYHGYMNYNIKHHLLLENYDYLKQNIIEFFGSNRIGSFPYKLVIENMEKTLGFIKNDEKFLEVKNVIDKKILKDKKVLVIGAGPSLDGYMEFIKQHQDKFVIVAVDVILRKLEKHNIVPDIVVSIDPSYLCAGYLTCEDDKFLDNSTIIFLAQQDESVLKVVEGKNYVFSQSVPLIKEIDSLGSVPNVGTFSFNVAVHFGATEIYLIGIDSAFNQTTGSKYADDSSCDILIDVKSEQEKLASINVLDVIETKGNFKDTVKTNIELLSFKDNYESSIFGLLKRYDFTAYNLSDGAYINGFVPKTFETMAKDIEEFPIKNIDIVSLMDTISTQVKMPDYTGDIKELNKIITKVKKIQKIKLKSKDTFLEKKLDLMVWILEVSKKMDTTVFGNIFMEYSTLVDIYINYALNIKQKNIQSVESINKINIIYLSGLLNVLKTFKEIYNKYK
jgi:hypothetical protein